ncbi:MAG: hypothetical protein Cons2KO_28330 [Congregibacter sp.]
MLRTQPKTPPGGALALIGGRFEADNDELFAALRERCDARIAVLSMASGYPAEVGAETVEEFRAQGFYAEHVPIYFETRSESPFDEQLIERLRAFGSVFFTGGDQSRIVGTLVQNGQDTPALRTIRALYNDGGLIAGSSAGAAIMSGPMIRGGTSLNAVSRGLSTATEVEDDYDSFRLGTGLGFFQWGMVDQHFLARGRIGRLIQAAHLRNEVFAYGVDENSALIVEGERGTVVGETGVLFVDLRRANFETEDLAVENARISYLDSGDAIDLARGKPLPAADKRRVRASRSAYRSPAPVRRHAFSSYGLHDLVLRLVEAELSFYSKDSASAFDAQTGHQVTLHISRQPRRSRALRAVRQGEIRYTALNFRLDIQRVRLDACPLHDTTQLLRLAPAPDARLILLGNAPARWSETAQMDLLARLPEPIGILATASGEPAEMAERYLDWLDQRGRKTEILPISLNNIERVSRDRALLATLGRMGSILLTGGDQRRLTEALLHCAEATPVLHSLVTAYEKGTPLVAVAGAATALGAQMIAEGDSLAALRYGSSEDAGFSGVVIERGIGLTRLGLIDQHFMHRRRLGRLLIACAEQKQRFGFGLSEGAGMIVHGDGQEIEALGTPGVVVVELDQQTVRFAPHNPDPSGIRLYILEPGRRVRLDQIAANTQNQSLTAAELLNQALEDLAADYRAVGSERSQSFDTPHWRETLSSPSRIH